VSVPSSELGPPHPLLRKRVCLPPWTQRGGGAGEEQQSLAGVRGWGDPVWAIGKKAWQANHLATPKISILLCNYQRIIYAPLNHLDASNTILHYARCTLYSYCTHSVWSPHGGRWRARTYGVPALFSLLATCVVFWSYRRRDIVNTAVLFSPERMYITLDSSTCTSYPSLKRHKYIWRFCKATGLHELSSFLLS
jgi:hypothetical protein